MGWRSGGQRTEKREINIQTCDVCGKDIGKPDGYGSEPHYEISRDPTAGCVDDPEYAIAICSVTCLRKFADAETAPEQRQNPVLREGTYREA